MTTENKPLTRDDFFAAVENVEIAAVELGEKTVYLRTVDYDVIRACRENAKKAFPKGGEDRDNAFAREIIASCVCDQSGNLLLSHADAERLLKSQTKAFKKLVNEALKVNGLTDDANEAEKKE